jgi:hypothetical protein
MGKILYSMNVSLDGYVEDPNGSIAFSAPDEDVHRIANEQVRQASALLFGRRLYEVMEEPWTTAANRDDLPEVEAEFAQAYVKLRGSCSRTRSRAFLRASGWSAAGTRSPRSCVSSSGPRVTWTSAAPVWRLRCWT